MAAPADLALAGEPTRALRALPPPGAPGELRLVDLYAAPSRLAGLLADAVERGQVLDAFLLSAGLWQLAEDHCSSRLALLRRAASYLPRQAGAGAGGRSLGSLARHAERLASSGAEQAPSSRRVASLARRLGRLTARLAAGVVVEASGARAEPGELRFETVALARSVLCDAGLLDAGVLRLPSCFHSFDQHPRDVMELVRRWRGARGEDDRPVAVVGIRTSGSYLAPIAAAELARAGVPSVEVFTLRPGWTMPAGARARLSALAASGAHVLILDDPPISGASVARAVDQLATAGVRREQVALLLAAFGDELALPPRLAGVQRVVLPYAEWDIVRRLAPENVAESLGRLVEPARVAAIEPLAPPEHGARGHAHGRYRLAVERPDGVLVRTALVAEGVGLGYFGRQSLALAEATPELFPEVIGVEDGLLFRRHLSSARRWHNVQEPRAAEQIAAHLARRHAVVRVDNDPTPRLAGRRPAWEIAAQRLTVGLGPLGPWLRPGIVEPLVRRLLVASAPVIVDGDVRAETWFLNKSGPARKIDFATGPFGHHDLASYDPLFDLAGVALEADDAAFERALRDAYSRAADAQIDPARLMVFKLVHAWNAGRLGRIADSRARRVMAAAAQELFAACFLDDLAPAQGAALCALDIDGVLETGALGFPSLSIASALSLRALRAHGHRVVLATGRSLGEVIERCRLLGLDGGVAEYGAAAYVAGDGSVVELASDAGDALARLAATVEGHPGLARDPAYRRSVRCWRAEGTRRHGLVAAEAEELLSSSGLSGRLVAVLGREQTDFVPVGTDKADGLAALLSALSERSGEMRLALAVGDSEADRGLLSAAGRAFVPAHGDLSLATAPATIVRHSYQAGLADAVAEMIGHRPGDCPRCAPRPLEAATEQLLRLLSVHEGGKPGIAPRLARLALGEWRAR